MKIVIDIPIKTYEHIRSHGGHGIFNIQGDDNLTVTKAIFNGTVEERPTGNWIGIAGAYRCDKCYGKQWYRSDYCPTCGAEMRVKNELNNELNHEKEHNERLFNPFDHRTIGEI